MRQIVAFALQQRALVLIVFAVFIAAGAYGFAKLNIEAYPDPVPPQVVIITQNPGQSAEEIERYVTIPVELAMAGLPNLNSVRSTSLFGLSDVRVQFTFAYTYEQALQQVLNRLAVLRDLPDGARPAISPLSPIGEIMRYRVVGPPGFSVDDLKTLQEWVLERRFRRVPGVVDVSSFGGRSKSYNVVVDLPRLNAFNLSLPAVIGAVRAGNVTVGAGMIQIGPQSAVVQGVGLIRSTEDMRNIVLGASEDGTPVLLSDVATVEVGSLPRLGIAGHEADEDVVLATVLMRRGEQTLPTIHGVQREVARINAGGVLPPGVRLEVIYDREELVKVTTKMVVKNIILGVVLILIIQWLFLGDLRGAVVVAATIPFAFFFAVLLMLARGESANLLSLGSLDFGLLVDATIIMVENIYRHLTLARRQPHLAGPTVPGMSGISQIILRAGGEVGKPIAFALLIVIVAFIPLFTMGGIEGRIFGPMAKTYAYAIFGSLVAAFTVVPALSAVLLREDSQERDTWLVRHMRTAYAWLYRVAMRARELSLLLAGILVAASIFLLSQMGAEFLPTLEEGNLYVRATMPGSISLEEGHRTVQGIRATLLEFPEALTVTSQQGRPDDGTDPAGFFNAEFFIPLRPPGQWTTAHHRLGLVAAINQRLEQRFLGVQFSYAQMISDNVQEAASGVKGENAIKVFGPELDVLTNYADRIRRLLGGVRGLEDVAVFPTLGQPTVAVTIDRARAARFGLAVEAINDVVQAAIGGRESGRLYEPGGDRNFPIVVRLAAAYRNDLENIARIPVGGPRGAVLGDVADVRLVSGTAYVYREDGTRYVPIRFSVRGRDPASAVREAQALVERELQMAPGYRLDWVGEFRNLQEAVGRLLFVVPIALAIIMVLLYVQFGNIREMLLVMAMVPLSLVGGILALAAAGLNFSVPAAIGFLALFGITVMEGIILVAHFNHLRHEGMPWRQALDQSGQDRLRPVFMTCFASFFGLLPMALATGIGADVTKPLALVVVGGIGLVPIFILVTFPALIDRFGRPRGLARSEAVLAERRARAGLPA